MSNYENRKLDNQLCFALYAATNAIIRSYRARLGRIGLTYPQYLVLMVLWETDGRTIRGLADRLHLDSGSLTPIVKRLESAGIVKRQRDESDERVVHVYLTAEGRTLEHEVAKMQQEVACQTGLQQVEFVELRTTLHQLADSMTEKQRREDEAAA